MSIQIDKILHGKRRRLRTNPEKLLMNANGLRLWADYLDPEPGFSGRIDFIHKINIPALFRVQCSAITEYEPAEVEWEPSNILFQYEKDGVHLKEYKFITESDAAVSCMTWENQSEEVIEITVKTESVNGIFPTTFGEELAVQVFCNGQPLRQADHGEQSWKIPSGSVLKLCVAAQVCLSWEQERMKDGCQIILERYTSADQAIRNQKNEYQAWFEQVPEFSSDQPLVDKTWAYRWYILRHNRMNPGIGNLKETFFSEGRSHKMTKTPYQPEGWEFSKLIPLSVPMHLLDLRWYQDKSYGTSILHVMRENQDEAGEFHCAKVNWQGNAYANFFGWSVWKYYLISGNRTYAEEALPVVKKQIAGWRERYGNEQDVLLTQYVHQLTGMEYQPSYWYFHNFPDDCRDEKTFTPVKRVDRNVYYYLNLLGAANLCRVCCPNEETLYREAANEVRRAILADMWDEKTGFFYDLHYKTKEKAFVKNIVGVFPFFAGIADQNHRTCMETLLTEEFDTPCPFPSVSTKCPVFTGEGGWKGHFFKGRNGCIWNGPAWPFANSMVLDGIGKASQKSNHEWDEVFQKYFMKFTKMHYYGGDGIAPYLVEHYNSLTGECISDDVDYSHSYYIDLVVRYLAGISVEEDQITIDPLDMGLQYFSLKDLWIRGYKVSVEWSREHILKVYVDDTLQAQRTGLGKLEISLFG